MSKALGVMNRKLSIYEKEFLAVLMAVEKWRQYLQRGPFLILTDHQSLCTLSDQQLTMDLQRKAMAKLVGLQFQFKYKRGVENGAADSLSRVGHLMDISVCRPDWVQEVLNSYTTDPQMTTLLQQLTIQSPDPKGFALEHGLIKYKGRIVIGDNLALQTKLISQLHDTPVGGHSGIHATYQRIKKIFLLVWPQIGRGYLCLSTSQACSHQASWLVTASSTTTRTVARYNHGLYRRATSFGQCQCDFGSCGSSY
jgi:hypothetical protein